MSDGLFSSELFLIFEANSSETGHTQAGPSHPPSPKKLQVATENSRSVQKGKGTTMKDGKRKCNDDGDADGDQST